MERIISPPLTELSLLRQPLTAGERLVLDLFSSSLDPEWEIYVQPHLNGLRPDFVLLHPKIGIAVFEVKDWDLDAMDYFVCPGPSPELWARKDGKEFSRQMDNPISKAQYYREAIFNLYCPRLAAKRGFGAITAGVIFPFADTKRLRSLFGPFLKHEAPEQHARHMTISGASDINNRDIRHVFPDSTRSDSIFMRPELAADLRGWLVEPDFSVTQRRPLEMNAHQRQLSNSRTENGLRRIKGPAGSGKSLVLAARAAKLADEGKSVLVATYNITLWHYLRDLIVRSIRNPQSIRNIVFVNFHSWCRDICEKAGWSKRYDDLWQSDDKSFVMETSLAKLVLFIADAMQAPQEHEIMKDEAHEPTYDAILVDEGQDYLPLWWNTLRRFLKPNGEMLMVADGTQDIYGTVSAWTDDAMTGAGFRGKWSMLDVSYRLPPEAVPLIRSFADRFMSGTEIDLPLQNQAEFDLAPCRLRWIQCSAPQSSKACTEELLRMMHFTGTGSLANADITFLAANVASGRTVVEMLDQRGIKSVSTFAEDGQERRREKVGFYMGDARIKATTIHSFKGWESPSLVIHVGTTTDANSIALIYTGLTRLKNSSLGSRLTIISSSSKFLEYAKTWPNFIDITGATGQLH